MIIPLQLWPLTAGNLCYYMILHVELEKHAPAGLWKMKPQFHMAQELCEFDLVNLSLTWVYRDEDYGGSLAKTSKHRGGFNTPSVISKIHSPSLFLAILCPHGLCSEKDWKWLPLGKGGDLLCRRNGISRVGDMTYLPRRRKNMNPVQEKETLLCRRSAFMIKVSRQKICNLLSIYFANMFLNKA